MKQVDIITINKTPVTFLAGHFLQHPMFDELAYQLVSGRVGGFNQWPQFGDLDNRVLVQIFQHAVPVTRGPAELIGDKLAVLLA